MAAPALVLHTLYAELLERCASAAFSDAFSTNGAFIPKVVKGRTYWYFQSASSEGRTQKYVGPETPDLLNQIAEHKEAREDERERRTLVSTLLRSFGLARPLPEIGSAIATLANAGVFRRGGVLVGTVAYQTYSAMLGVRLAISSVHTDDVDVAQAREVAVAAEHRTEPMIEILKGADASFRPIPSLHGERFTTAYKAKNGLRVDFLTPNRGPDTDLPQSLPELQTDAQPLRFLDYLIDGPEPAVVLHGTGIYTLVPAPHRYALHKLIVSRRRPDGSAKREKDIQQAESLLRVLTQKRASEVKGAWDEAFGRGKKWRTLIAEGMTSLTSTTRDITLKAVDAPRDILPGADLAFNNPAPRYDFSRDVLIFEGISLGSKVQCEISREALDDFFKLRGASNETRVQSFLEKRSLFEDAVRTKYLSWPVEQPDTVLAKTGDMSKLLHQISGNSKKRR